MPKPRKEALAASFRERAGDSAAHTCANRTCEQVATCRVFGLKAYPLGLYCDAHADTLFDALVNEWEAEGRR